MDKAERVRQLCREGGMKFERLNYTPGTNPDATAEEIAEAILKVHKAIEADKARPMEERLYDEYLALFRAMQRILQRGYINVKDEDFSSTLAVRLTGIGAIADCALMPCNLIRKEDRIKAYKDAQEEWQNHIERTL